MRAVKVRKLPKQKSMTMAEFEQEVQKWTAGRDISFSLDFKPEHMDEWDYEWLSPEDEEKADASGAWTLGVFGHDIEPGISLAASSLLVLLQMFAQYELQPIPRTG
jgi:hypothetical protein